MDVPPRPRPPVEVRRAEPFPPDPFGPDPFQAPPPPRPKLWLHAGLFVATFGSMVLAGGTLAGRDVVVAAAGWTAFVADGLRYAVPFLLFLAVHEFGHYAAARRHGVAASLPYFLPVPVPGTLGTLGAVIRIYEPIRRLRALFDIGASGPLAGVAVALGVLAVAVWTLPPPEYLLGVSGHEPIVEALRATGRFPVFRPEDVAPGGMALVFGDTPLFHLLSGLGAYRVPGDELMHFPLLLAGWLGLFFTALNLLPVGQLDGGHVVYALFGPRVHGIVARVTVLALTVSAGLGFVGGGAAEVGLGGPATWPALALLVALAVAKLFEGDWRIVGPGVAAVVGLVAAAAAFAPGLAAAVGYSGWWLWIALLLFVVRVDHPPVPVRERLTPARVALGVLCIAIFLTSFSVRPITVVLG